MKRLQKKVSQSRELFVYKREITLVACLKEQMCFSVQSYCSRYEKFPVVVLVAPLLYQPVMGSALLTVQ